VVERRRQPIDAAPGTPPAPSSPFGYSRRILSSPVNDNRPAALRGMLGTAILVAIGCALAWLVNAWIG